MLWRLVRRSGVENECEGRIRSIEVVDANRVEQANRD